MKRDDFEYFLLYNKTSKIEDIRFYQGHLQGLIDVMELCNTLDKARVPTEEEKKILAQKRNPTYPSQAEVMGELRSASNRIQKGEE